LKFQILAGNLKFQILAGNSKFQILAGNLKFEILAENLKFEILAGNLKFQILAGNLKFQILAGNFGETVFVFNELTYPAFLRDFGATRWRGRAVVHCHMCVPLQSIRQRMAFPIQVTDFSRRSRAKTMTCASCHKKFQIGPVPTLGRQWRIVVCAGRL
jgi:hypothetical protein